MLYRENGQFKTSYRADQQIFPILQDRIAILAIVAVAVVGVPLFASSAKTIRIAMQRTYFATGLSIGTPSTESDPTATEPDVESLVSHLMRRNAHSTKNCAASVATAR